MAFSKEQTSGNSLCGAKSVPVTDINGSSSVHEILRNESPKVYDPMDDISCFL